MQDDIMTIFDDKLIFSRARIIKDSGEEREFFGSAIVTINEHELQLEMDIENYVSWRQRWQTGKPISSSDMFSFFGEDQNGRNWTSSLFVIPIHFFSSSNEKKAINIKLNWLAYKSVGREESFYYYPKSIYHDYAVAMMRENFTKLSPEEEKRIDEHSNKFLELFSSPELEGKNGKDLISTLGSLCERNLSDLNPPETSSSFSYRFFLEIRIDQVTVIIEKIGNDSTRLKISGVDDKKHEEAILQGLSIALGYNLLQYSKAEFYDGEVRLRGDDSLLTLTNLPSPINAFVKPKIEEKKLVEDGQVSSAVKDALQINARIDPKDQQPVLLEKFLQCYLRKMQEGNGYSSSLYNQWMLLYSTYQRNLVARSLGLATCIEGVIKDNFLFSNSEKKYTYRWLNKISCSAITEDQFCIWKNFRNSVVHSQYDWATIDPEQLAWTIRICLDLYYSLLLLFIGYKGECCDFIAFGEDVREFSDEFNFQRKKMSTWQPPKIEKKKKQKNN